MFDKIRKLSENVGIYMFFERQICIFCYIDHDLQQQFITLSQLKIQINLQLNYNTT